LAQLIPDVVSGAPRRLWRGLTTWPHLGGWRASLEFSAIALTLIAVIGFASGFYRLGTVNLEGMPLRLLSVVFVPALGEEAVFRGLLLPDEGETRRPLAWLLGSTAVYSAWHVFEAATFMPKAWPIFTRPDFLAITFVLGIACALMRRRTGSLWPPVILHWLLVTLWQTFLGAPTLAQLA
jgi:predicted Abi (CAAX) family protease